MLISPDNHVFPIWAPDWLRDQVASPDCSIGTHPRLRQLAKWLTIYFKEQPGGAKRWLSYASERCARDVNEGEIDRLLTWAEGIFGSRGFSEKHETRAVNIDLDRIYLIASKGWQQNHTLAPKNFQSDTGLSTMRVLRDWADYAQQADPWICFGSRDQFWTRRLSAVVEILHAHEQITPSPMQAQFGRTADGRLSEHSKEATGKRLFLVVEFDFVKLTAKGKPTIWAPLLERCKSNDISVLELNATLLSRLAQERPLWMIVFSGGKSLQGWFPCRDEDETDLQRWFTVSPRQLGACSSTWCKSQFVRMPGGSRAPNREGKSVRQAIFYYNPNVL